MKARPTIFALLAFGLVAASFAAEEKDNRVTAREALKARILEENAKKQASNQAATPAPAPAVVLTDTAKAQLESAAAAKNDAPPADTEKKDAKAKAASVAKAKEEPATVLPKVEVNRSRINELDGKIIQQEKEIAHEKQNAKPTEVDKALNNPKVSKALSIFGGESSSQRATVASERVKIMEEERDILEAMKAAKTKEEKAELQKELDELRAYRRELEKSLR